MFQRISEFIARYFFLWTVLAGGAAFLWPDLFTWFLRFEGGLLVTIGLALIMLGMGLTLSFDDFTGILRQPVPVITGVVLQYTIMPALGWAGGYLFALPVELAVGLVLVAACPGGTASNVITFLARGNVALSVSMTACSTFLAALMTPLLTFWLAGSRVEVPVAALFRDTLVVVILPVVAGLGLNQFFGRTATRLRPLAPVLSVVMIVLIVAAVLGQNRDAILNAGPRLLGAVWFLHGMGFFLGYVCGRVVTRPGDARTISIEVGMQNSGLGVKLAGSFPSPLVAVPSAISSITHCIIGAIVAAVWSRRPVPVAMEKNE